jgi:hypothetical protein
MSTIQSSPHKIQILADPLFNGLFAILVTITEFSIMRFTESLPSWFAIASFCLAGVGIWVIWSRKELSAFRRGMPTLSLIVLAAIYAAAYGYAIYERPAQTGTAPAAPPNPTISSLTENIIKKPFIEWNGGDGPMIFHAQYNRTGNNLAVFIQYGIIVSSGPIIDGFINWERRRFQIDFKERYFRDAEMKSTVGLVSNSQGGNLILQIGGNEFTGSIGKTYANSLCKIILVLQDGTEESFTFAIISSRSTGVSSTPIMIVGPSVFLDKGQ